MGLKIQKNVVLAPYTTYKIGGPARYFCEAKSEEEIVEALHWAKKQSMPFFILGGGSNILVSDKGFDGVIIRIHNTKYIIHNTKIVAEAGIDLPKLVKLTINSGLKGLEWASGIPGTFGGAIRGNAGAFGNEIKDRIKTVRFLDEKGNVQTVSREECRFSYRDSMFKQNPGIVILSAVLEFEPGNRAELEAFSRNTIRYRASKHPLEYGSCGSVFKAVDARSIQDAYFERYPRLRASIKNDPFPVVPAACFIDEAGLKRYRIGGARISDKHPNFFVNEQNAKAEEVLILMSFAKQRLLDTFNIVFEEEIQLVGWQ